MASRSEAPLLAYRIVRSGYPAFDGAGAARHGGRWSSRGRYVIHAAESYALSTLENLVHFNIGELPPSQVVVQLRIPAGVSRERVTAAQLPGWDRPYPNGVSQEFGDRWCDELRSAVLIVPSTLSPYETNILINQLHPDTRHIGIGSEEPALLDRRLAELFRLKP